MRSHITNAFVVGLSLAKCRTVLKTYAALRKRQPYILLCYIGAISTLSLPAKTELPIPDAAYEVLSNYCLDCHDEAEMKGDVNLDPISVDWGQKDNRDLWEKAHYVAKEGFMPPAQKRQPSEKELAIARFQGKHVAELAIKLHG